MAVISNSVSNDLHLLSSRIIRNPRYGTDPSVMLLKEPFEVRPHMCLLAAKKAARTVWYTSGAHSQYTRVRYSNCGIHTMHIRISCFWGVGDWFHSSLEDRARRLLKRERERHFPNMGCCPVDNGEDDVGVGCSCLTSSKSPQRQKPLQPYTSHFYYIY